MSRKSSTKKKRDIKSTNSVQAQPERVTRTSPVDRPINVGDADFDREVSNSEVPVLVDFWAPWCMPCRMVGPVVEEIAGEFEGRLHVAKMNTDESPVTPGQFGIMGIPTLILFKGGEEVERLVGVQTKHALVKKLGPHLDR